MTDDNTTETDESQEGTSEEDSPVIKAIRKENRDLKKRLDSQPTEAELLEKARAVVARESAIDKQLIAYKVPTSVRELVEAKLGDAEITPESVKDALVALDFQVTSQDESGDDSQPNTQQTADDLAAVASLGNQVANAASQPDNDNITDKLNKAETPAEVAQIMRDAGLGQ